MIFYWLFCKQYQLFLSTCGACSEVVFEFEMKSNLFQIIEGQTHFSTSWHAKMSLTMNQYRIFFNKPPHYYLQTCSQNLPNMECAVSKTSKS